MSPRVSDAINYIKTKAREAPPWWHVDLCRDHKYARSDENQKTMILGKILPKEIHDTPGKILARDDRGPRQDPFRGPGKTLDEDVCGAASRPTSAKAPSPLPCSC